MSATQQAKRYTETVDALTLLIRSEQGGEMIAAQVFPYLNDYNEAIAALNWLASATKNFAIQTLAKQAIKLR